MKLIFTLLVFCFALIQNAKADDEPGEPILKRRVSNLDEEVMNAANTDQIKNIDDAKNLPKKQTKNKDVAENLAKFKLRVNKRKHKKKTPQSHEEPVKPAQTVWLAYHREGRISVQEVEKEIHKKANNKKKKFSQLAEEKKKKVRHQSRSEKTSLTNYVKMTMAEFKNLKLKLEKAEEISKIGGNKTVHLALSASEYITDLIERSGEDLKELCESYVDTMINFSNRLNEKLRKMAVKSPVEDNLVMADKEELKKISYCSGHRLREVFENSYRKVTSTADSTGKEIIMAADKYVDMFEELGDTNELLQRYVGKVIAVINDISRESHDRLMTIAEECLDLLRKLLNKCVADIDNLRDTLVDILWAIAKKDKASEEKHIKIRDKNLDEMLKSNTKRYKELAEGRLEDIEDFRSYLKTKLSTIKSCVPSNAEEC